MEVMDSRKVRREEDREMRAEIRAIEKRLSSQTTVCDGSSAQGVRQWIREIELVRPLCRAVCDTDRLIIRVAEDSVSGSLRIELCRYLERKAAENNKDRYQVDWDSIKKHLQKTFLAVNEEEFLKDDIQGMQQSPYETLPSYNRRFREAADMAYPDIPRNSDQVRILVKAYLAGINDDELVKAVMKTLIGKPRCLDTYMDTAAEYDENDDEYLRLGRAEKAMEVAAASPPVNKQPPKVTSSTPPDETLKLVRKIASEQGYMKTQINSLQKTQQMQQRQPNRAPQQQQRPAQQRPAQQRPTQQRPTQQDQAFQRQNRSLPKFDQYGQPRCFQCNQYGHMARQHRQSQQPSRNQGNEMAGVNPPSQH